MVLQYRYPRLPLPLIVKNTFSASHSIGVMNVFGEITYGNLTSLGKWDAMENWTVPFLL